MKQNSRTACMLLFGATLFLAACQNDVAQELANNKQLQPSIVKEKPAYTAKVSSEDAQQVAEMFSVSKGNTRVIKNLKEIKVINNAEGEPVMFVVNFADNQGFVLVSATRNFLPVLAYNDEGNFSVPEGSVNGLNLWIERMQQNVKVANDLPADSTAKFRNEWRKYESAESFHETQTRNANSELDQYAIQLTQEWGQNGTEWCMLGDAENFLPANQFQAWCELAAGAINPMLQDVDYMTYSFVTTEVQDLGSGEVDNFVHTKWFQKGGYNDRIQAEFLGADFPAGCTTIAMAQIMRYHKYPTNKNWDNMPYNQATTTTSDFIYEVAKTIGVTLGLDGSSASIEEVKNAFIRYGYSPNIQIINHNSATVQSELDNRRPVYMRGENSDGGHAWLASGYDISQNITKHYLHVPVREVSIGNPYEEIGEYTASQHHSVYFYMNWGWEKNQYNGFYNDLDLSNNSYSLSYNNGRKDIVNITPGE